jgi:hypothetical protein
MRLPLPAPVRNRRCYISMDVRSGGISEHDLFPRGLAVLALLGSPLWGIWLLVKAYGWRKDDYYSRQSARQNKWWNQLEADKDALRVAEQRLTQNVSTGTRFAVSRVLGRHLTV